MVEDAGGPGAPASNVDADGSAPGRNGVLATGSDHGAFELDGSNRFVAVDDAFAELTGHDREALVGEPVSTIAPDVDAARLDATVRRARAAAADVATLELSLETADGETLACEVAASPLEPVGDARGAVGAVRSVAAAGDRDRTLAPAPAGQGDERFRSLVRAVEEYAIFALDADGRVASWNEGAERIKGYERAEIVGEHFSTFYTDEAVADGVPDRNLRAAAELGSIQDEGWRVRADGTRFWANVTITAVRDDDGDLAGYLKVTRDMTDRRERERRLRREHDRLERVLDAVPVSIGFLSPDGTFARANARADERLGTEELEYDAYHVGERDVYDVDGEYVPPEDRPYVDVFETGEPVEDWLCQIDLPDRGRRWLSINAVPLEDEDGDVERVVVSGEDVTQFKEQADRLERRQAELEDELDEVFDRIDDAVFALDDEFRFTYVNGRAEELLGRDEEVLVGEGVREAVPEVRETPAWDAFRAALDEQEPTDFEAHFEPLDVWVEATVYPSESGLSVYFRDVTELKARERALEESERRYRAVVENFPNGAVVLFDEALRYTAAGGGFLDRLGLVEDDVVGRRARDVLPASLAAVVEPAHAAAMRGEERSFRIDHDGRTYRFRTVPIRDDDGEVFAGLGMSQDVTERVEAERRLEEERDMFAEGPAVVFRWRNEPGWPIEYVSDNVEGLIGYAPEDLESGDVPYTELLHDEEVDRIAREVAANSDGDADRFTHDPYRLRTRDGDVRWVKDTTTIVRDDDGRITHYLGYLVDVTERKERERDLELYETIVSTMEDGVYVLDEEFRFEQVNDAYVEMTGYDREELVGAHCSLVVDEAVAAASADQLEDVVAENLDGGVLEADLQRADGETLRAESRFTGLREDDGTTRKIGVVRDVSDRVERERALERRVRQQETVTDLGRRALEDHDLDELLAEASALVAETLDTDYCGVLDLDPEAGELSLRQGVGWDEGAVGEATVPVDDDSQVGHTLGSDDPVVTADLDDEDRFAEPPLPATSGIRSGICTVVGPRADPWGILAIHDAAPAEFSGHDVNFVQSVANILASAIDRHEHEGELQRQRERLAALNELNGVVRGITDAVIEQSTREEIEATVCERLADVDSYRLAWIADVDHASGTLTPRAEAGADGYLEQLSPAIDPRDPAADGPAARALRTGDVHVGQRVLESPDFEPWREYAREYGYRSIAAIPVVHEGTRYGLLAVYADRPDAFEDEERTVVGQLGEIVGHAIASVERMRALTSDEVVELEFLIEDLYARLDLPVRCDDRVSLERAVPAGDDEYLVYGTTTGDGIAVLEELTAAVPHWEAVRSVAASGGRVRFEARLAEPPVLTAVASEGGYVADAHLEGGDYHMTIQLPHGVDPRAILDIVEEAYPSAELLAQRQVTRDDDPRQSAGAAFEDALTDRQRGVLEAAYFSGYFEWPRESSGEEIAESLDISAPTFSQHLRAAENKVFGAILEDAPSA